MSSDLKLEAERLKNEHLAWYNERLKEMKDAAHVETDMVQKQLDLAHRIIEMLQLQVSDLKQTVAHLTDELPIARRGVYSGITDVLDVSEGGSGLGGENGNSA